MSNANKVREFYNEDGEHFVGVGYGDSTQYLTTKEWKEHSHKSFNTGMANLPKPAIERERENYPWNDDYYQSSGQTPYGDRVRHNSQRQPRQSAAGLYIVYAIVIVFIILSLYALAVGGTL